MKYLILLSLITIGCSHRPIERVQLDVVENNKIKIAVVDTGSDMSHDLLKEFKSEKTKKEETVDDHGHGTHVAGIVAMNLLKAFGEKAKELFEILPFKIGKQGTAPEFIIRGKIKEAITLGAKIINLSISGEDPDQLEYELLKENPQVLFIVAAGNEGGAVLRYPCGYNLENVICVGNNFNNKRNKGSNYGPQVKVFAEGTMIESSFPNNEFARMTGTSQATPVVSAYYATKMINKNRTKVFKGNVIFQKQKNYREITRSLNLLEN